MNWNLDDLRAAHDAQELQISSRRPDGSLRKAVPIWHAAADGALYVRSAYGPDNGWYRRAKRAGDGHISAGGVEQDVAIEHVDPADAVHETLDVALRQKYAALPQYVAPILTPESRATTLRLTPRT